MDNPVKRGTVFHERFYGEKAVPFIDDGYLNLQVCRKEDAGGIADEIRFGIAVSIEAEGAIPVYDEICAAPEGGSAPLIVSRAIVHLLASLRPNESEWARLFICSPL